MQKVLVLCTGNSCRSIIAEALINIELGDSVVAYSSGVKASGRVNPYARKVLEQNGYWDDRYHSKVLDKVMNIEYDLVVTVCDNAKESCPIFPQKARVIHVGFQDPDGKEYSEFEKSFRLIKERLIPIVQERLEQIDV